MQYSKRAGVKLILTRQQNQQMQNIWKTLKINTQMLAKIDAGIVTMDNAETMTLTQQIKISTQMKHENILQKLKFELAGDA